MNIFETNQKLLDILGIDQETRKNISSVTVHITPDAMPTAVVTQIVVVDSDAYSTTTKFEIKEIDTEEKAEEPDDLTYVFETSTIEAAMLFEQELKKYGIHGLSIQQSADPLSRTPYSIGVDRLNSKQYGHVDNIARFAKERYR